MTRTKQNMKSQPKSGSILRARALKQKLEEESTLSTMERMKRKRALSVSARPVGSSLSGISQGDFVRLSWPVDPAYGGGVRHFKGVVTKIDDWITVVDKHGGILHTILHGLDVKKA